MGPQITGVAGRVDNVHGEKQSTDMPPQNMGTGENSEVAQQQMERNKAAYAFDHGSPASLLAPLVGFPGSDPVKPKDQTIET
jgi:hypothetical protein